MGDRERNSSEREHAKVRHVKSIESPHLLHGAGKSDFISRGTRGSENLRE
jgi:hypothetical protein